MPLIMQFNDKARQEIRIREHRDGQAICVMVGGRIGGKPLMTKIDGSRINRPVK